jgi:hypothetical protein
MMMTEKHKMTEAEMAETLATIKRGPELPPMDVSIRAADMTPDQRARFIREASRRAR